MSNSGTPQNLKINSPAQSSVGVPPGNAPANNTLASNTPAGKLSEKNPDATWNCTLAAVDAAGKVIGELPAKITVGDEFSLICQGDSVDINSDSLGLVIPKEQRYSLKLLKANSISNTKADFVATTWTPGALKLDHLSLTDGKKTIALSPMHLEVGSVIDPQKEPKPEAAPPWGAVTLSWPVWIPIVLTLLAIALFVWIGFFVRTRYKLRRFYKKLESNPIALTPYQQFNKDLRQLNRSIPLNGTWESNAARAFYEDMDQALRWYIARELYVQVLEGTADDVVRRLREYDKNLDDAERREYAVLFSEIEKSKKVSGASSQDAHQLMELSRKIVDRIQRRSEAEAKSQGARKGKIK